MKPIICIIVVSSFKTVTEYVFRVKAVYPAVKKGNIDQTYPLGENGSSGLYNAIFTWNLWSAFTLPLVLVSLLSLHVGGHSMEFGLRGSYWVLIFSSYFLLQFVTLFLYFHLLNLSPSSEITVIEERSTVFCKMLNA